MSLITDEIRRSATEFYVGDAICQEKTQLLLSVVGLPNGLLPLQDIEEVGYVKEAGSVEDRGFVWLIQKKKCQHNFDKIGKVVHYAKEVTAYVEPNRIRKLTGVKTKELLMWVNIGDISVEDPPTGKVTFRAPTGLFRSFPVEAFQIQEVKDEKVQAEEEMGNNHVIEGKKEELNVNIPPAAATDADALEVKEA